jgi:hypothetical protein
MCSTSVPAAPALRSSRALRTRTPLVAHLLSLPGYAVCAVHARIAWASTNESGTTLGVQFYGLGDATRDALDRLVLRLRWMGKAQRPRQSRRVIYLSRGRHHA